MKVINRHGLQLEVSYDEINQRIARLCGGPVEADRWSEIDIHKVVIQTISGIYDGITTAELDDLSARICANLQSFHYLYDVLASRILTSNLAKNARVRLEDTADGSSIDPTFSGKTLFIAASPSSTLNAAYVAFVRAHAKTLDSFVDYGRDSLLSYFAIRTLEKSYLMRLDGQVLESPQDMWMRVAVAVSMPSKPVSDLDEAETKDALATIERVYNSMSLGDYTHATPTLFNAGMKVSQLSSCFLLGIDDSLDGIFKTLGDCAQISKWAGGIGIHVSNIRAKGARIASTNGTSDGIIPMIKVFNETARYCNQSGRRKGSIAIYLEPWHADSWEFAELRRKIGRAHV